MSETEPSMQEWKELYDAAVDFKQHECWNYMWDSDIFGVQNPETGEIGYCCVMGRNGEHFALGVYKGTEGLEGLISVLNGDVDGTDVNALHIQNCLMASFEDRKYLNRKDIEIIKNLGLRFRGRNAWPLFRDYTPGFHPWYLTSKDARFLSHALKQAIDVALRVEENPDLLSSDKGDLYMVRVPVQDNDEIKWKDEWLEPEAPVEAAPVAIIDDLEYKRRLENIKKSKRKRATVWEVGTFFSSEAVQDGSERPYYPKLIVSADHDSGIILSHFMSRPIDYQADFIEHFVSFLEGFAFLPGEILASDEEILDLLSPIAEELEIELYVTDHLEAIEDFQDSMWSFFR